MSCLNKSVRCSTILHAPYPFSSQWMTVATHRIHLNMIQLFCTVVISCNIIAFSSNMKRSHHPKVSEGTKHQHELCLFTIFDVDVSLKRSEMEKHHLKVCSECRISGDEMKVLPAMFLSTTSLSQHDGYTINIKASSKIMRLLHVGKKIDESIAC